jgi:RNA polymerase sigma-70 factor (ECF subfamily)
MPEDDRADIELLAATRSGEASAYGAFFSRNRDLVLAYLGRRTANAEVAADLLAETFAAALVAVLDHDRRLPDEPLAWLMAIARNKLIDSIRRGQVEQAARDRLALEPLVLDDEGLGRVERLIDTTDVASRLAEQLPPDQLQALRSRIFDERDYAEMARDLRCSEAVVRKRVSRALQTLRGAMEGRR